MTSYSLDTAWGAILRGAALGEACDLAGMRGAARGVLLGQLRRLLAGEARLARVAGSIRTPELMLQALGALDGEASADSELARAGIEAQTLRAREARLLEQATPLQRLAQRCSVSDTLAAAVHGTLGEAAEAFLAASWTPAPLCLRANSARIGRDELRARLESEGVRSEPTRWSPHGLRVLDAGALPSLRVVEEGLCEVQDEASQLVAQLVDPLRSAPVVDACAGAGGKTLAMCAALGVRGRVAALDVDRRRLAELKKRAARAQAFNLVVHELPREGDPPDALRKDLEGRAARVLVDAPCSGLGALRRKPDLARRVDEAVLQRLPEQQLAIARGALRWLRPDGRLVYATCTPLAAENEGVVARLCAEDGLEALPLRSWLPATLAGLSSDLDATALRLSPHEHGTDGFVVHVLRRRTAVTSAPPTAPA